MSRFVDIGRDVMRKEADAILQIMGELNADFDRVVEVIDRCRGRVVLTGMGKSGLICRKIASTLSSIGVSAIFLHPAESVHGDLGILQNGDVVIVVSNSGETEEIIRILPWIRRMDIVMVVITSRSSSTIATYGDVVLVVQVREACPYNVVPTASTTATLALGDAIAIALMVKRDFRVEDFASFHPGGTLGRKLLLTVEDLMHTGDAMPKVYAPTPMKDVILEITSKRLGVTTVLGENDELIGIITDGDLRRAIEKYANVLSKKALDVMTRNPKVIRKDALATYALKTMEEFSITSLVVLEGADDRRPKGILHIHDLLKAKIA